MNEKSLTHLRFWKHERIRPLLSASSMTRSASSDDLANGLSAIAVCDSQIQHHAAESLGYGSRHTMFSSSQGFLSKRSMGVGMCCDNNKLRVRISEELLLCAIVPDIGEVDFAVGARRRRRQVFGSLCSLKDGDHLVVIIGGDEGQVKVLGGEAIAHNTNFDGGHDEGEKTFAEVEVAT